MNKTKGFILGYALYLFAFILSFTFILSASIIQKSQLENNLIELEKQKCIELVFYSYFTNHLEEDTFSLQIDDYYFEYECSHELFKNHLKVYVSNKNQQYIIHYYYDKEEDYVDEISYEKVENDEF